MRWYVVPKGLVSVLILRCRHDPVVSTPGTRVVLREPKYCFHYSMIDYSQMTYGSRKGRARGWESWWVVPSIVKGRRDTLGTPFSSIRWLCHFTLSLVIGYGSETDVSDTRGTTPRPPTGRIVPDSRVLDDR